MGITTTILACVALTGFGYRWRKTSNSNEYLLKSAKQLSSAHVDQSAAQSPRTALASLLLATGIPTTGWQVAKHCPGFVAQATGRQLPQLRSQSGERLTRHRQPCMEIADGTSLIVGKDLALSYTAERYLFEGVSVSVNKGLKLALIGPNGEGKSSLMKVLAGMEKPDKGSVDTMGRPNVAYVEQEPKLFPGKKAVDFFLDPEAVTDPVKGVRALFEYRAADAAAALAGGVDEAANERLLKASARMDETQGWLIEQDLDRLLEALNVHNLMDREASTLSGGERKRVALAAALVHNPELLLLDEPTNHLDMQAIRWLENEISSKKGLTAMIVTHDRAFLEGACEEILELDRSQIFRHRGSFEKFLVAKQERIEREEIMNQATRDKLKREQAWAARGCKARATKSEWRLENMEKMAAKLKEADRRMSKSKADLKVDFDSQRLGNTLVSLKGASLNTPSIPARPVFYKFSYDFVPYWRIGIIGGNGAGKSTFLKAMQGELPLESGKLEIGETVVFGYFRQEGLEFNEKDTLMDVVTEAAAESPNNKEGAGGTVQLAMKLLNQFLFPSERWDTLVKFLSGGEQRRLQLLKVLARQPNVLLLDEPTNDLDLGSIAALEEFLADFKGVLVVVSHDRYFLDQVCNRFLVLDGRGKVLSWDGSVEDYVKYEASQKKAEALAQSKAQETAQKAMDKKTEKKSQWNPKENPRRLIKVVDAELKKLTEKQEETQKKVDEFDPEANTYVELGEWTDQLSELGTQIEEKEEQWIELTERIESMSR